MNYKSYILVLFITYIINTQPCLPLYWQTDFSYAVESNQMKGYGTQKAIQCADQHQKYGPVGNKSTYSIKNIQVLCIQDESEKYNVIQNNTITTNRVKLNLTITFDAQKSGTPVINPSFTGKGSMNLNQITVQYSKTLQILNGIGSFINATVVKNILGSFSNIKIQNNPGSKQLAHFLELINGVTYNAFQDALQIQSYVKTKISKQNFPNKYESGKYNYVFNSITIPFNMGFNDIKLINSKGIQIGYIASIPNQKQQCSIFSPVGPQSASYFTIQLIKNLVSAYISDNKWQNYQLDSINYNGNLFNFFMVDLQDIMPTALAKYPQLLSKLYANCQVDTQNMDVAISDGVWVILNWSCGLFHSDSQTNLINFNTKIQYIAKLNQVKDSLKVNINSVKVLQSQWMAVNEYPLLNEELAGMYLEDLVKNSLQGSETLGNNFNQPKRIKADILYNENVIGIVERGNGLFDS